jgi:hypothetical protein
MLGDTLHRYTAEPHAPSSTPSVAGGAGACKPSEGERGGGTRAMRMSYHAAYLKQRQNMYLACPPSDALLLPPHIQRLIGYSMPGPVLNKLYCGAGSAEILPAYLRYYGSAADGGAGRASVDWAGAASQQIEAQQYAQCSSFDRMFALEEC